MQDATTRDRNTKSTVDTAFLALGSNLGDRLACLRQGVRGLAGDPRIRLGPVSSLYETAPVGGPVDQGWFLNAVLTVYTDIGPQSLLTVAQQIEARLGRERSVSNGPRTIDVDLLTYADCICDEPAITLPHPRMHTRLFVMVPLAEIAPDGVHARFGRPFRELLDDLRTGPDAERESIRRVQGDDWV
jgi:2-amino-4-hydroxy-6-hydroxymethyldihydropteridine diphosphokinase